jgi:hypothetical protein
MPVYPVRWEPFVKSGYYTHMAKLDAAIWERFMDQYGVNFQSVAYDVALGGFLPDEDSGSLESRKGWQYTTALKIDAVLLREGEVWIVEIKPGGGTAGIGAALCYTILAERDGFSPFPVVPVLVTDRSNPDVLLCADELGVTVIAVDEPLNVDIERSDETEAERLAEERAEFEEDEERA